jgi:hypothetical protein
VRVRPTPGKEKPCPCGNKKTLATDSSSAILFVMLLLLLLLLLRQDRYYYLDYGLRNQDPHDKSVKAKASISFSSPVIGRHHCRRQNKANKSREKSGGE